VKEHPGSWWGWYALGYTQFAQQKVGESIKSLAKSLQLNIKNADAHKVLGRDMMLIGRFDAAQIEFEQSARLDPKSAEVRFNLGKLFSIQDNWAAAKRELEAAIRLDPSYVEAYDALGLALESLGDDAGAVANYEKAIRLNAESKGTFTGAYVNLSALRNREGNTDAALENARQALLLNPRSDRGLFQIARALERRGDLNAAVESISRAIALNSHASSYYYVLGTILRRLGRSKESQEAFESFRKLEKDSSEIDRKRRELAKEDPVRFGDQPDGGGR
jgi:tetratricopeptide (TPR) repeat protein